MRFRAGAGAGTRDDADWPNLLRGLLGEEEDAAPAHLLVSDYARHCGHLLNSIP